MTTTLLIGGNRGIGLELCRQLKERGDQVIATCRTSSTELDELGVNVLSGIDVSTESGVEQLKAQLGDIDIDILIHSAGILTNENFTDMDFDRILTQFKVNTLGPLRVVHGLRHQLKAGSKVAILSSRVGSMDDNGSGGMYGYRVSKAAVNMVGVNLAHELKGQGIAVALLHPGLVATAMTSYRGIDPSEAARGLIERVDQLNMENTGNFWHAEGYPLPW